MFLVPEIHQRMSVEEIPIWDEEPLIPGEEVVSTDRQYLNYDLYQRNWVAVATTLRDDKEWLDLHEDEIFAEYEREKAARAKRTKPAAVHRAEQRTKRMEKLRKLYGLSRASKESPTSAFFAHAGYAKENRRLSINIEEVEDEKVLIPSPMNQRYYGEKGVPILSVVSTPHGNISPIRSTQIESNYVHGGVKTSSPFTGALQNDIRELDNKRPVGYRLNPTSAVGHSPEKVGSEHSPNKSLHEGRNSRSNLDDSETLEMEVDELLDWVEGLNIEEEAV